MCQLLISVRQRQPVAALIYLSFTWAASPVPPQSDYETSVKFKVGLQLESWKLSLFPHTQIRGEV